MPQKQATERVDEIGRKGRRILNMLGSRRPPRQPIAGRFHFQGLVASSQSVTVRGGTWDRFAGGDRNTVHLTDAGGSSGDMDDLTAAIDLSGLGNGTAYVVGTLDDILNPATLTASATTTRPAGNDHDVVIFFHVPITAGTMTGPIVQDWQGGNILDFTLVPDAKSTSYNSNDELQAVDYENAGAATPDAADLFWYKDVDADIMVMGATPQSIVEAVGDWSGVDLVGGGAAFFWSALSDTTGDPITDPEFYIPMTLDDAGQTLELLDPATWGLPIMNVTTSYKVAGTKVLGAQQGAIADIADTTGVASDGTCRADNNAIKAALRAHGIIAT